MVDYLIYIKSSQLQESTVKLDGKWDSPTLGIMQEAVFSNAPCVRSTVG